MDTTEMRFQANVPGATILPDVQDPVYDGLAVQQSAEGVTVLAYSDSGDSWHSAVVRRVDLLSAIGLDGALVWDTVNGEAVLRDTLPIEEFYARGEDGESFRYQPLKVRK